MDTAFTLESVSHEQLISVTFAMPAGVATHLVPKWADELSRIVGAQPSGEIHLATFDSSLVSAPFDSNHRGDEDAWSLPPISDSDLKLVCWAVDNWSDNGRRLVGTLLVNASGVRTLDLAESVGYSGGIPSAFRAIAGRLRAIDRAPFWFGDPASKGHPRGQRLWCDTDGAPYQVVRDVFTARYPELLPSATLAWKG